MNEPKKRKKNGKNCCCQNCEENNCQCADPNHYPCAFKPERK